MKFLCDNCKAKYQIGDEKVAGKTVRMKCRKCGHLIQVHASVTESSVARGLPGLNAPTPAGASTPAATASSPGGLPWPGAPAAPGAPPRKPDGRPAPPGSPRPGPVAARSTDTPDARPTEENDEEKTTIMSVPPRRLGPLPAAGRDEAGAPRSGSALGAFGMRSQAPGAPRPAAGRPPARPVSESGPLAVRAAAAVSRSESSSNVRTLTPLAAKAVAAQRPAVSQAPDGTGIAGAFARAVTEAVPPAPPSNAGAQGEDWYVGVAGVPLGPIRLSVIREKAAQGAVDGDSLVWREGFDEWQPLKNFPELLEIVSEAATSRFSSIPARRSSVQITPVPPAAPARTAVGRGGELEADAAAAAAGSAGAFGLGASGLGGLGGGSMTPASAHELGAPSSREGTPPPSAPVDVLTDPFRSAASAPFANGASHTPPVVAPFGSMAPTPAPEASLSDPRELAPRRGMHPMAYAFIAASLAFGGVAAYVLLTKPPPAPQIVVVQGGGTPSPTSGGAVPDATVEAHVGEVETNPGGKPVAGGPRPGTGGGTTAAPGTPAAPIDTSGFGTPGGPAPGPGPGSPGSTAGQGQLSAGEIQGVVSQNQPLVKRKCWQPALDARTGTGPASAKVTANLVIGPSGNVDSVSAGGGEKDFPGLSTCVAGRIKGWKFPPSGGSTPVTVPFVFAGQ